MVIQRLVFVPALLLALGQGAQAQVPLTAGELPMFPGLRETERETVEPQQDESWQGDRVVLRGARIHYEVAAAPEEVFRWYQQRLGGTRLGPTEVLTPDYWPDPGIASEVQYSVTGHDLKQPGDRFVMGGAELRQRAEQGGRRPLEPGLWLMSGSFAWRATSPDGESTEFMVDIQDGALNSRRVEAGAQLTRVTLSYETGYAGDRGLDHIAADEEAEMQETLAARAAEMGATGPTEAELGIPPYPGARFDAEMSAGFSMGDEERIYIYLSDDPIEKVVAFYETRTGKKATKFDEKTYMLAVTGTLPFPELGVTLQGELPILPGVATVISIRKAR